MNNIYHAFLLGSLLGVVNGFLSRYAIKKVLNKSDRIFYSVFVGGILYRFLFLILSIWYLRDKKAIILLVYCACLIVFQFIFEVKPIKISQKKRAEDGT